MGESRTVSRLGRLDETKGLEAALNLEQALIELKEAGTRLTSELDSASGDTAATKRALDEAEAEIAGIAVHSFNQMLSKVIPKPEEVGAISLVVLAAEPQQLKERDDTTVWSCVQGSANGGTMSLDSGKLYQRILDVEMTAPVACFVKVQFCLALHELAHLGRLRMGSESKGAKSFYANEALPTFMYSVALAYLYSDVSDEPECKKAFGLLDNSTLMNEEFNRRMLNLYKTGNVEDLVDESIGIQASLEKRFETDTGLGDATVKKSVRGKPLNEIMESIEDGPDINEELAKMVAEVGQAAAKALYEDMLEVQKIREGMLGFIADAYTLPQKLLYLSYLQHNGDAAFVVMKGFSIVNNRDLTDFAGEIAERYMKRSD
ncbi:MAG: hypothetical protein KGH60_03220 [Candidatus Micrarchaeota archaeon]|nr:hypothetical protein [Candidatus Micrarchaeota archaeon]